MRQVLRQTNERRQEELLCYWTCLIKRSILTQITAHLIVKFPAHGIPKFTSSHTRRQAWASHETKWAGRGRRGEILRQSVRVCTMRAFEGALYSLGVGGYARSRERLTLSGRSGVGRVGWVFRRGVQNRRRKGRPQKADWDELFRNVV